MAKFYLRYCLASERFSLLPFLLTHDPNSWRIQSKICQNNLLKISCMETYSGRLTYLITWIIILMPPSRSVSNIPSLLFSSFSASSFYSLTFPLFQILIFFNCFTLVRMFLPFTHQPPFMWNGREWWIDNPHLRPLSFILTNENCFKLENNEQLQRRVCIISMPPLLWNFTHPNLTMRARLLREKYLKGGDVLAIN